MLFAQPLTNAGERVLIGFAHIFFADQPEIEPELSLYN